MWTAMNKSSRGKVPPAEIQSSSIRSASWRGVYNGMRAAFTGLISTENAPITIAGFAFALITFLAINLSTKLLNPNWVFMWAIAVVVYGTCKVLTWMRAQPAGNWRKSLVYLFFEPGLNAKRFLSDRSKVVLPCRSEWVCASIFFLVGILSVAVIVPAIAIEQRSLTATVGMIGVVLILHFGFLDLLSLTLRSAGFASTSLMNEPWRATGVADFWSRWNTGFRDLSREFIFYPLVRRKQAQLGLWATFLFSGLVHDLVISIPAHGGYGLPTLYFLIQALAISFERSRLGKTLQLNRGWTGWLFTAMTVLLPVSLLVHFPFQENVIIPMLRDLGNF
ncbi:MBOAT family protein [Thalassoglobus polymorphus]|uniref:MBOAT family protein n=1 Tax=Thalassoglobus polymorphus TaxID=2527994 RepID=A0A517QGV9_9PLAN|nr:MBOAT family protein [Thalassoglobus polymorphus]QDT30876.1 MBOAT family protein [Thalassoglobus polymorphus]